MAIRLKVSTDKMVSKANEITVQITTVERNWSKMKNLVKNTKMTFLRWQICILRRKKLSRAGHPHSRRISSVRQGGESWQSREW